MEHLDVVGLLKAAQALERNVTIALMYAGLRIPQFRLLDVLAEMGQATVTEMSEKLHITRATASVLISEMLRSGIIAMLDNPMTGVHSTYVSPNSDGINFTLQEATLES